MRSTARALIAVVCMLSETPVTAAPDASALCNDAARIAAAETGVPLSILSAIMLAETGRGRPGVKGLLPWPWTLHADGEGMWLDTRVAARARLERLRATGRTNIDIGCFQINLHWHGAAYPDPAVLLDPLTNARHAARFLADLHDRSGDWRVAAGRYHSHNAERAESYVQNLEQIHATAGSATVTPPPEPRAPQTGMVRSAGMIIDMNRRLSPLIGHSP